MFYVPFIRKVEYFIIKRFVALKSIRKNCWEKYKWPNFVAILIFSHSWLVISLSNYWVVIKGSLIRIGLHKCIHQVQLSCWLPRPLVTMPLRISPWCVHSQMLAVLQRSNWILSYLDVVLVNVYVSNKLLLSLLICLTQYN